MPELHPGPMPLHVRWPVPPHIGGMPTGPEYNATPQCEARNGEARCWRRQHPGGHEDTALGWWEDDDV